MRRLVPAVSLLIVLMLGGQSAAHSPAPSDEERYQIYNAVIAHMFAGDKINFDSRAKIKQIVIRDQANTNYAYDDRRENWVQIKIRLENLSDETIAGYEAIRTTSAKLKRSFILAMPYSLFTQKDYESIFGMTRNNNGTPEYWNKFYAKFPDSGGYVWLSNVGFNKAHNQALVYHVHWCGVVCGTGHYILLGKGAAGWRVVDVGGIWIS